MSIRHPLAVLVCMVMAMALLWSKALLAILPGLLAFIAVTDIQIRPFRVKWTLSYTALRESIRSRPHFWIFSLFFFLYLVSIFHGGDLSEWWSLTHMKVPFLVMAMCFALLDLFSRKDYMLITLSMVILVLWSSIWVQVAYYQNFELFNQSVGYGSSLPTPGSHIRFSSMVAISLILCLGFAIENWTLKYKWERWAYALIAIYLFYFLHILSVRSGLVQAYVGIAIIALMYLRKLSVTKQIILAVVIVLAPVVAYKIIPGFQMKVHYTLYDLKQFRQGEGDQYSDSQRWDSWKAGLTLGNHHPFTGIGPGHYRAALEEYYTSESKPFSWRPQNQWINVFALFGLPGLALFILVLLYPMMTVSFRSVPMIAAIYIIQIIIMMVEHPLDTAVGTALFLLVTLLGLSFQAGLFNPRIDHFDSE